MKRRSERMRRCFHGLRLSRRCWCTEARIARKTRSPTTVRHLSTKNLPLQYHRGGSTVDCGVIPPVNGKCVQQTFRNTAQRRLSQRRPDARGAVAAAALRCAPPGWRRRACPPPLPPPLPRDPPTPPPATQICTSGGPDAADSGAFRPDPHEHRAVPRRSRGSGRPRGDAAAPAACRPCRPRTAGGPPPATVRRAAAAGRARPGHPATPAARAARARCGNLGGGRRARGGTAARRPWRLSGRAQWPSRTGSRWRRPRRRARRAPRTRARPPAAPTSPRLVVDAHSARWSADPHQWAQTRPAAAPLAPRPDRARGAHAATLRGAPPAGGAGGGVAAAAAAARGLCPPCATGGPPQAGGRRVAVAGRARRGRPAALSARPCARRGEARDGGHPHG